MYLSHEDRTGERAPEDSQDEADVFPSPAGENPESLVGVDPFALWAATSGKPLTSPPAPEPSTRRPRGQQTKADPRSGPRPAQQDRRTLIKLLAVGATGLVTVVTVGGISLARAAGSPTQAPARTEEDRSEGSTAIDPHREGDDGERERDDGDGRGRRPHKTPTPQPTPRPSPSPTQPPPSPTPTHTPPSPTPTPPMTPTPTGTVIGHTSQATNSAVSFTNPADGQASWLVHMSNGNFVAVEQACTHAGCPVKYNTSTGQFNCPCHGAIFNADGTHPQAPATTPLPPVHITVNANGTITSP